MSNFIPNPVRFRPGNNRFDSVGTHRGFNLRFRRHAGAFRTKDRFPHLRLVDPYERWLYEERCTYPTHHYKFRD